MAEKPKPIIVQQFNLGGLSDSIFDGAPASLAQMVGTDPHSKPGVLCVAQAMVEDSGGVINEFCMARLASSNGRTYWGSVTSGKIWERDEVGVWTLVHTISPDAGSANILNMIEHGGWIFIATQSRLHYIVAADALGASQWNANIVHNWGVFTEEDPDFKPMVQQNLVLYIGDGKLVAQVDQEVFSPDALDVAPPLRVKSLGRIGTRVLVGTYVSDNITKTEIIDWDTFSDSFRTSDPIDEVGINAFFQADNYVFVQCGLAGNIYMYNGEQLELYRKMPGDYSPTKQATVHPNAVANIEGQILFGMSNVLGNPCKQGVYRIGRYSASYPYIPDLPYPISERNGDDFVLEDIEIGAVLVVGADIFASWKHDTTYGVDKLDHLMKLNGAYIETRVARPDRFTLTTIQKIEVAYFQRPTGTDLTIAHKNNYANDYETPTDQRNDDARKLKNVDLGVDTIALQARITFTTIGNDAPEIEAIHMPLR